MRIRLAAVFIVLMLLVPVSAAEMTGGKIVWRAQYQQQDVITVTRGVDASTGSDLFEVWVNPDCVYQEYPLNSIGYNGAIVLVRVREIRPGQPKSEVSGNSGMRDPSSIFRAPKVVYGVALERADSSIFLEIREVGENYLIVVTKIIPQAKRELPVKEL